eukprot:5270429-Pyramimonas_sp.AAC.1
MGLTYLEARSVSRPMEDARAKLMNDFTKWTVPEPGTVPERDWALASYGAELYFQGATAADFSKARAAAAF